MSLGRRIFGGFIGLLGIDALGATLRGARIRGAGDDRSWTYNPDADQRLATSMTLVGLGSPEQVDTATI